MIDRITDTNLLNNLSRNFDFLYLFFNLLDWDELRFIDKESYIIWQDNIEINDKYKDKRLCKDNDKINLFIYKLIIYILDQWFGWTLIRLELCWLILI